MKRDDWDDKPYTAKDAMPADLFYVAIGIGLLLVLALGALGVTR